MAYIRVRGGTVSRFCYRERWFKEGWRQAKLRFSWRR